MRRWAIWIPVLMVASMLYWMVALGLGGLSLVVFGLGDGWPDCQGEEALGDDLGRGMVKDSYQVTTVSFVDPAEEAPDEGARRGISVELVEDRGQGSAGSATGSQVTGSGPGDTAW